MIGLILRSGDRRIRYASSSRSLSNREKKRLISAVSQRENPARSLKPDVMNSLLRDPRRSWWYIDSNPVGTSPRSQQRHSSPALCGTKGKTSMLSADYVVGLVDGEGSLCVYPRAPNKATWNTSIECHFYIKMRDDDLGLLKKVQNFFSCGSIFFQKEYRQNQRDNYRYQVSRKADLKNVIIPFFKSHPLQSKRIKDFELFCEILGRAMHKEHHSEKGLAEIVRLKELMHA